MANYMTFDIDGVEPEVGAPDADAFDVMSSLDDV